MVTKDSTPSMQSRSTTTPTGEESVTPVSQPSSLGELFTSMVTEMNRKLEVIQRAQVSSLMGADKTKEPPEKLLRSNHPPWLLNPRSMPWRCGWKSRLVQACTPPPRKTLTALILQLMLSTMPIQVVPACTRMWPAICWPSTERRLTLGQASSMIKSHSQ